MTNNRKSTRYYSERHEKLVAKTLGGRVQPNSGATSFALGDVKLEDWLLECKTSTTVKDSYSIKKIELEKLNRERYEMRKGFCALCFNFGESTQNYYVIDEGTMKQFLEVLEREANGRNL